MIPVSLGLLANPHVVFMIQAVCYALAVIGLCLLLRVVICKPRLDRADCPECGYSLRGLSLHGPCPECGLALGESLSRHCRRRRLRNIKLGAAFLVLSLTGFAATRIAITGVFAQIPNTLLVQLIPYYDSMGKELRKEMDRRLIREPDSLWYWQRRVVARRCANVLRRDASPEHSRFFIWCLAKHGPVSSVGLEELAALARDPTQPNPIPGDAAWAIAHYGTTEATDILLGMLLLDREIRWYAADALRDREKYTGLRLQELLEHPNGDVRAVVAALVIDDVRAYGEAAWRALLDGLSSENREVLLDCLNRLSRQSEWPQGFVPKVSELAEHSDQMVRRLADEALQGR